MLVEEQQERKQWIIVRKDINMPPGKMGAQIAHASIGAMILGASVQYLGEDQQKCLVIPLDDDMDAWLGFRFTKVVLEIGSEEELLAIYDQAILEGFRASKIIDSGLTFFNHQKTLTCVGLGAHKPEAVHHLVGHLKTYRTNKPSKS